MAGQSLRITLKAPTSRHSKQCGALRQAFHRAQSSLQEMIQRAAAAAPKDARKEVETEDRESLTGDEILIILASSTAVDLPEVYEVAKDLFSSGVALVDGETKLTRPIIDNMWEEDFESMLGKYLVNFTLASDLAKMKDASSRTSAT